MMQISAGVDLLATRSIVESQVEPLATCDAGYRSKQFYLLNTFGNDLGSLVASRRECSLGSRWVFVASSFGPRCVLVGPSLGHRCVIVGSSLGARAVLVGFWLPPS